MKPKKQLLMKNFLKPLALIFCMAAIASCSKKDVPVPIDPVVINPVSDYTVTPDPNDGFTFKFNNLSKDYTKVEWRFGDDTLNTELNPTHTYLATGQYLVDLKTYSKTGEVSHSTVPINIHPDDILKVTATKTDVLYQLQFTANVKGNVKSILWTFNQVDPVTSEVVTTKSTELNPLQSFAFGSFNNFSVTVTTDKGSVATVSKSVTTDGLAEDITLSYISYNSTNENTDQGPNEGSLKLVDGNPATKFGFYKPFPVPEIATLQFAAPVTVKLYAIQNGNDSGSSRDPNEWYVEGSNDGISWDQLDHQVLTIGFADYLASIGQGSTQYNRFFYYPIAHPQAYQYYRWRIVSTFEGAFQIDEFKLFK
jgi:hypothetical protein